MQKYRSVDRDKNKINRCKMQDQGSISILDQTEAWKLWLDMPTHPAILQNILKTKIKRHEKNHKIKLVSFKQAHLSRIEAFLDQHIKIKKSIKK